MNDNTKICIGIIHYNTPDLTLACVLSLQKHTPNAEVVLIDNSDKQPFDILMNGVEVIDNTHGQYIDWPSFLGQFPRREWSDNNYGSAKHCYSVQWLMEHLDAPFILMDSDVLIRQDVTPLWDESVAWVGRVGCNTRRRFGFEVFRLEPFLCFINTPMVKAKGVRYFNPQRMWCLVDKMPYSRYDTGAWFLEDCNNHHLPYKKVDIGQYCTHFGHASWMNRDASKWLKDNKELWI